MEKSKNLKRWIYVGIITAALVIFALWLFLQEDSRQKAVLKTSDTEVVNAENGQENAAEIYVHITGAVNNPGVIKLAQGSRLIDAIEKLGGLAENADTDSVNPVSYTHLDVYKRQDGRSPGKRKRVHQCILLQ